MFNKYFIEDRTLWTNEKNCKIWYKNRSSMKKAVKQLQDNGRIVTIRNRREAIAW